MLKKLIVTMALVGVTAASYGQGQVNFNTQAVGALVNGPDGLPAAGNLYFARLYAANGATVTDRTALAPVGNLVNFRAGGNAGYVQVSGSNSKGVAVNPVVDVTTVNGGPVTVQLRAWGSSVDTFEAAAAGGIPRGESNLLGIQSTGNPGAQPPTTPVDLTGLQGFTMVPEPSTVALGVLGAAALLFARRRK